MNKALAAPGPNQMMASEVRGTRVYGANNENVGDINDILIDEQGDVIALVVGVGGFLGIGQKDVAIPFKAFEFVAEGQAGASRTSSTTTTTSAPPASTAPRSGTGTASAPARTEPGATTSTSAPATTGSTPDTRMTTTTSTQSTSGVLKLDRIVLRGMTKADLEAAPEFKKTASRGGGDTRSAPANR